MLNRRQDTPATVITLSWRHVPRSFRVMSGECGQRLVEMLTMGRRMQYFCGVLLQASLVSGEGYKDAHGSGQYKTTPRLRS